MFVILTQSSIHGSQVYRTVCYGPFDTVIAAREFGAEFLDGDPVTVVELIAPETIAPSAIYESMQRELFAS